MALSRAYFDTSALLKVYVWEEGSGQARRVVRSYRCLVSAVGPLELASAIRQRLETGSLTRREVERAERMIQKDRAHWDLVEVDRQVLERAGETVRDTGLRTLDAIHVASARVAQAYGRSRLPFVTGDARQRDACGLLGLDVIWVG